MPFLLSAFIGLLAIAVIIVALIPMRPTTRVGLSYTIDLLFVFTGLAGLWLVGSGFVWVIIIGVGDAAVETWRYRKHTRQWRQELDAAGPVHGHGVYQHAHPRGRGST